MNQADLLWRRLTAVARRAAPPPPPQMPAGLPAKVVAPWLAGTQEDLTVLLLLLGRRALLGAMLVMGTVIALSYLPLADTWTALSASGPLLEVLPGL